MPSPPSPSPAAAQALDRRTRDRARRAASRRAVRWTGRGTRRRAPRTPRPFAQAGVTGDREDQRSARPRRTRAARRPNAIARRAPRGRRAGPRRGPRRPRSAARPGRNDRPLRVRTSPATPGRRGAARRRSPSRAASRALPFSAAIRAARSTFGIWRSRARCENAGRNAAASAATSAAGSQQRVGERRGDGPAAISPRTSLPAVAAANRSNSSKRRGIASVPSGSNSITWFGRGRMNRNRSCSGGTTSAISWAAAPRPFEVDIFLPPMFRNS